MKDMAEEDGLGPINPTPQRLGALCRRMRTLSVSSESSEASSASNLSDSSFSSFNSHLDFEQSLEQNVAHISFEISDGSQERER